MKFVGGALFGLAVILAGCNTGGATAVPAPTVPKGWEKQKVGSQMTMVLPPYLQSDKVPKESVFSMLADLGGSGNGLNRTYIGPDAKGRECMVLMTAIHVPQGRTNPEGAINEMVDMMSGMGATDVTSSKRKVELPIGPAWRGVVTMGMGGEAMSMILYAGVANGRYYQVNFIESGAGDVVLVEDDAIMDSVRFE